MGAAQARKNIERVAKYADMFSAMGTEPRLRIMQLLLSAHPAGLVVGEIQAELGIPNSTLSHHLNRLILTGLVTQERQATTFICRANSRAIDSLLGYLIDECCADAALAKTLVGEGHSDSPFPK